MKEHLDSVRALLKRCCRGGCRPGPNHACDQASPLEFDEVRSPGSLESTGPLSTEAQRDIENLAGRVSRNNKVRLLLDGTQAYGAMLDLVRAASEEICFENFILRADALGLAFSEEMRDRALTGNVAVRILHDPFGSRLSAIPIAWRFRDSGARVRLYNPPGPGLSFFTLGRDHRKLVVQDRRRLVAGGMCLADLWLGHCVTRCTWRDSAILVEGEGAAHAARKFDRLWNHGVGLTLRRKPPFVPISREPLRRVGDVPVRVIADLRRNRVTEQILVRAFRAARREILITNQYCLPTPPVMRELVNAAQRGVEVRLILPQLGRPLIAGLATEHRLGRILVSGIRVWRWSGPMIHAKTVVVDRIWSLVGSSNLDAQSLRFNAELNVEVHGSNVGEQMAAMFGNDLRSSEPFTLEAWKRRSPTRKVFTAFAALPTPIL